MIKLWVNIIIAVSLIGSCAAQKGDLKAIINLPSNVPEPWRPPEPTFPGKFPKIITIAARLHAVESKAETKTRVVVAKDTSEKTKPEPNIDDELNIDDDLEYGSILDQPRKTTLADKSAKLTSTEKKSTPVNETEDQSPSSEADPEEESPYTGSNEQNGDQIPKLAPDAKPEHKEFHESAVRAVNKINNEDFNDPSIALSLKEKLFYESNLAPLRGVWVAPLESAIARANNLKRVGLAITGLERAFKEATLDAKTSIYKNIDIPECRKAIKRVRDKDKDLLKLTITIKRIGKRPFSEFEIACLDSHSATLMDRDFPPIKGPNKLRRFVKKKFKKSYPNVTVHKVTIERKWQVGPENRKTRTMKAIVGIERKNVFPDDPCVMQTVILTQQKDGRRWKKTSFEIQDSLPLACQIIK